MGWLARLITLPHPHTTLLPYTHIHADPTCWLSCYLDTSVIFLPKFRCSLPPSASQTQFPLESLQSEKVCNQTQSRQVKRAALRKVPPKGTRSALVTVLCVHTRALFLLTSIYVWQSEKRWKAELRIRCRDRERQDYIDGRIEGKQRGRRRGWEEQAAERGLRLQRKASFVAVVTDSSCFEKERRTPSVHNRNVF